MPKDCKRILSPRLPSELLLPTDKDLHSSMTDPSHFWLPVRLPSTDQNSELRSQPIFYSIFHLSSSYLINSVRLHDCFSAPSAVQVRINCCSFLINSKITMKSTKSGQPWSTLNKQIFTAPHHFALHAFKNGFLGDFLHTLLKVSSSVFPWILFLAFLEVGYNKAFSNYQELPHNTMNFWRLQIVALRWHQPDPSAPLIHPIWSPGTIHIPAGEAIPNCLPLLWILHHSHISTKNQRPGKPENKE